jgi:hypothetical protein
VRWHLPQRLRRQPSSKPYSVHCAYSLGIRTWNASNDVPYVKPGRIPWQLVNTTCWRGGTHQRFKPCNRYQSRIVDNVITTGLITATAAVNSSSAGAGLRSNLVNFDRKRPTSIRGTDRQGHKAIGGGTDEDQARTLCATDVVSPVTSRWTALTHLSAKRRTRGKL